MLRSWGKIGGQTSTKWKDAGHLQGDVWLCNSTLEIRDYKRDNFFLIFSFVWIQPADSLPRQPSLLINHTDNQMSLAICSM